MLPIKYRLKKRKTFNYIHKNGSRAGGEFLHIVFCVAGGLKIGFSASKKVGNSVVRHRAVRLMREAVKPFLSKIKPNINCIIVAKEGIEKQHLIYITLDIEKALKKSGIMIE